MLSPSRRLHQCITIDIDDLWVRNDDRALIAHLLRRAGFGSTPGQLERLVPLGYAGAVSALLLSAPDAVLDSIADPVLPIVVANDVETLEERKARAAQRRSERQTILSWWLERMVVSSNPLREKMTLFWHGHFATSIEKVTEASFMLAQNQIFRSAGLGRFEPLVQAVAKDPAMMIWLDSNQNRKGSPNENFARELMELFTIGIGSYTDADVREAARSFTGWRINRRSGVFSFLQAQADLGPKTVLGRQVLKGEEVISLLSSSSAAASFVSWRLWSKFSAPTAPNDAAVADLAKTYLATNGDIAAVMKALFLHPAFVDASVRQGLVKQPIEYVVGALRAAGLRPGDVEITGPNLASTLRELNQVPFDPPSVGGWPPNGYWISTATANARLKFANTVAANARLDWLLGVPSASRADALANQLGVDSWSSATVRSFTKASNPRQQFALALVSPEYVLN